MKRDTNWAPRFALIGDMGTTNDHSLKWLIGDVAKDMYDAVIHAGKRYFQFSLCTDLSSIVALSNDVLKFDIFLFYNINGTSIGYR